MLQGTDLVILGTVGSLLIFVFGYLFGKRNGNKVDQVITSTESTVEARLRAVENATQHLLTTHLDEAKAETATAALVIKQAIATVKPETIVSAIESEIKRAL